MANLSGKLMILKVWDGTEYQPLACLTSNGEEWSRAEGAGGNTITKCPDFVSESTWEDPEGTISFDAVAIDDTNEPSKVSYDKLKSIFKSETTSYFEFVNGLNEGAESYFYKGTLTNIALTSPADGDVTFTGSITIAEEGSTSLVPTP